MMNNALDILLNLKKNCKLTDVDVIGDLLQPMDKDADFVTGNNNYVWFYLIGKYFRPKVIVEMGTRFGYSMKAFVKGAGYSPKHYSLWSFDCESDGMKTLDIFEYFFRNSLRIEDIHINRLDTRNISSLNLSEIDLCFVDANHTTEGCYHECELGFDALKTGGVLIVDDVNYNEVKAGVEKFCNEVGLTFSYLPSLRGIYLIQKK